MFSKVKSRQDGFTIIEVLIVLAIAGLIMLVVFLAIPALQRNSRNTQRSNDVQNVVGAMQEYITNNNGSAATGNTVPAVVSNVKMTQLASINYTVVASGTNASTPATIDGDTLLIRNNLKCNGTYEDPGNQTTTIATNIGTGTTDIATRSGATSRTFVAIYAIERPGGLVGKCQEM